MLSLTRTNKSSVLNDLLKVATHENLVATSRHLIIEYQLYVMRDYFDDFVSLSQRIKQLKKVDESTLVKRWLGQIVDALEHLHAHDVYHGNLSADNVLVRVKDDKIMLTDFGYAHHMAAAAATNKYTSKCDVYSLGCLLFRCVTSSASVDLDRLDEVVVLSRRTKKWIRQMLNADPDARPTLAYLKTQLVSPFYMDLSQVDTRLASLVIDRKLIAVEATDRDEFLTITCKKRRNQIGFSMSRIKLDPTSRGLNFEKLNFNSGLLMTRNRSSCSCSRINGNQAADVVVDYPSLLPKVMCCLVDAASGCSFLVGCNSSHVYFFDPRLKYVKRMCLLEMLESSSNNPLRKQGRHSSMVKTSQLKLDVNSVCVDSNNSKLYLLLTVLGEICLLNVFRLDMTDFNKNMSESVVWRRYLYILKLTVFSCMC